MREEQKRADYYLNISRTLQEASIKMGLRSALGYVFTPEERKALADIQEIFFPGQALSGDAPHAVLGRASGILTAFLLRSCHPSVSCGLPRMQQSSFGTSPYTSGKGEANEIHLSAAAGGAALVSNATPAKSMERSDDPCRKKWKTGQSP